ncbi:MAG: CRISPR-associated helicase Cas3' [Candidatus Omnitrophica bacterium]|nr:CRISPR-associated helicase Cas3' [Candidatus Omnitrophota bacterium]
MKKVLDLLAKSRPEQTLVEHTNKVYDIWELIFTDAQYEHYGQYDASFWKKSLVSVIFHDVGKIVNSFQEMMLVRNQGEFFDPNKNFRHELFSGVIVAFLLDADILPTMAVFSHHKNLNHELFEFHEYKDMTFSLNFLIEFYKIYEAFLLDQDFCFDVDRLKRAEMLNAKKCVQSFNKVMKKMYSSNLSSIDRNLYIFYKGILQTCDWLASGGRERSKNLIIEAQILQEQIEKRVNKGGHREDAILFNEFQKICMNNQSDCLVIAPTGSGKTEAALLWAGDKIGKILYLLPTRVTSNAIYNRMKTYWGKESVGLVHSGAFTYLKDIDSTYEYLDYLLEKTFHSPLTVATVDQLLICGFNVGYWEIKEFNCWNARIIIDEVHAYDFFTLGLIVATMRHLKHFNAKFFIMTATIPCFLRNLFTEELKEIDVVENKTSADVGRNIFSVNDFIMDNLNEQIVDAIKANRKILLVVNTIDEAIRLFEKYEQYNPICYHSRFIAKDRQTKEIEIQKLSDGDKGGFVIATQVVEVALDIDFDVLFTENAPADAIIQRAGRVNRKGKKKDTRVVLCRHTEMASFYGKDILEKSFFEFQKYNDLKITDNEFLKIVDEVYKDVNIKSNGDFQEGLRAYEQVQAHYNYIQDVPSSDEDVFTRNFKNREKTSIVPMTPFYVELKGKKKNEVQKYVVDIPKYQAMKFTKIPENGFLFCDVDYNYTRGVKLVGGKKESSLMT